MDFDRQAYLSRIGLDVTVPSTETGLEALHRAQTYKIPFENFDIHLERGISLQPQRLFKKLVNQSRGGYCFELNVLFGMALDTFGFDRRPLLARVLRGGMLYPRTHMINLVHLNGRDWITDVGYGAHQLRAPMPFELDRIEVFDGQQFRLIDGGDCGTILQTFDDSGWQNLYSFDMARAWPIDIEMGNYFASNHPDFIFTWARIAARSTPSGSLALMDFRLREINNGEETVTMLEPGPNYLKVIEQKFGIVVDALYEEFKALGHQPTELSLDFSEPSDLLSRVRE